MKYTLSTKVRIYGKELDVLTDRNQQGSTQLKGEIDLSPPDSVDLLAEIFSLFGGEGFDPGFTFELALKRLFAKYDLRDKDFSFGGKLDVKGKEVDLHFESAEDHSAFIFELDLAAPKDLDQKNKIQKILDQGINIPIPGNIPVVQDALEKNLALKLGKLIIATADAPERKIRKGIQLTGAVKFFDFEAPFGFYLYEPAGQLPVPKGAGVRKSRIFALDVPAKAEEPKPNKLTKWIDVEKKKGPFHLHQIGFQFDEGKLWFMINMDFDLKGLKFSLSGLRVGATPGLPPQAPAFGLDGLGLSLNKGSVRIGGAFLKSPDHPNFYSGTALVQTSKFTADAFGGYNEEGGRRSFFVFASVDAPVGGPPFFYVEGFSLGFGYNMALKIPGIKQIDSFPLLNPALFKKKESPTQALSKLNAFIFPQTDNLWFAAGVQFNSFKMIDSKALLIVDLAKEQISLMGISALRLPKKGKAYVDVKMELLAFYKIREGAFQAGASIAEGSFLINPNCKVFGDFAFYSWFKGPYAGDFVLSIGGYHPRFNKPAHYPALRPLGFQWAVSKNVEIGGSAYFALTSSAAMAGFTLEASYRKGKLRAWFRATAHLLLQWKPFYYDVEIAISLGAKYRIFSLEIGAALHLHGPPVGGYVHIDWTVISFTVEFGSKAARKPKLLNWNQFKDNFLPASGNGAVAKGLSARSLPQENICRANIVSGLLKKVESPAQEEIWIVRGDELILSTESIIPVKSIRLNEQTLSGLGTKAPLGVRPMGLHSLHRSEHRVSIKRAINSDSIQDIKWAFEAKTTGVPEALWAPTPVDPERPKARTITATTGLDSLKPKAVERLACAESRIDRFDFVPFPRPLDISATSTFIGNKIETGVENPISRIKASLEDETTTNRRQDVILVVNNLFKLEGDERITDDLHDFADQMEDSFQSEPQIGNIRRDTSRVINATPFGEYEKFPAPEDDKKPASLRLKRAFRQYGKTTLVDFTNIQKDLFHENAPPFVSVLTGSAFLFELTKAADLQGKLKYSGEQPTQLFLFDEFYQILDYRLLKSESESIDIAEETDRIVLKGLASLSNGLVVRGWTNDDLLPAVNNLTLLGEQYLLRAQAPFKSDGKPALVRSVLEQNQYLGDDDQAFQAAVDTIWFTPNIQEVIVLMDPKSDQSDPDRVLEISIPYRINQSLQEDYSIKTKLDLAAVPEMIGNYVRLRYMIPNDLGAWKALAVRLQIAEPAQQDWTIRGIFALCDEEEINEEEWKRPGLEEAAFQRSLLNTPGAKVEFIYKSDTKMNSHE